MAQNLSVTVFEAVDCLDMIDGVEHEYLVYLYLVIEARWSIEDSLYLSRQKLVEALLCVVGMADGACDDYLLWRDCFEGHQTSLNRGVRNDSSTNVSSMT